MLLIFINILVKSYSCMLFPGHPESSVVAPNLLQFTSFSLRFYYVDHAEAMLTQGLPDWIGSHVRTLQFIGGVP